MAYINAYIARPSFDSPEHMDRHNELTHWKRHTAMTSAAREGIELGDGHWKVIAFLRLYCLDRVSLFNT
jgi:sulfur relay (sulfurtransferase) DsrC/TusE family protein